MRPCGSNISQVSRYIHKGISINSTYINDDLPYLELHKNQNINGCPKSHLHDRLTIVALEEGNLKLNLKNNQIILNEKQIAIINPFEIHSAIKIDKNSFNLYSAYFDINWIIRLQQDMFNTKEYILFAKSIVEDKKIYMSFINLCQTILSDNFSIKKEEEIINFLSMIMTKNYIKPTTFPKKDGLVFNIKKYIDTNINTNLTLEILSKEFLVTPFHIIRIFKQEFGLTPYQYILNAKINLSKKLISQNNSIAEVALECGFNDQSHLYKYFKLVFSITPKEYQKSIKR